MRGRLAAGGELGDGAARRRLGRLAAGVGVDLGVEHQDVDVRGRRRARGRGRRSRCRRPSRRRRRSRRSSSPARRPTPARSRAARRVERREPSPAAAATRSRWAAIPASVDWSASRSAGTSSPRAGAEPADQLAGVLPSACRGPGACRDRTRRCPRRASWTRPGRGRRAFVVHGVVGRLPP